MPASPVLRVEALGVRYGALVALDGMSWEVAAGRILGIIGPNGAGKSSCFAAVTNSVPHDGEVFLDGARVTSLPTWTRRPRPAPDLPAERLLRRAHRHREHHGRHAVRACYGARHVHRRAVDGSGPATASHHRCRAAPHIIRDRRGISPSAARGASLTESSVSSPSLLAYGLGARALLLDEPAAGTGGTDMRAPRPAPRRAAGARHRHRRHRAPHGSHHERGRPHRGHRPGSPARRGEPGGHPGRTPPCSRHTWVARHDGGPRLSWSLRFLRRQRGPR